MRNYAEREFTRLNDLYHSSDLIMVKTKRESISLEYRSTRYSLNEGKDNYHNSTKISFEEVHTEGVLSVGKINFIAVHPDIRSRGYGVGMVEVVESIFRERGVGLIDIEIVDNPAFWKKLGYSPRTMYSLGMHLEVYSKII